MAKYIHYDKIWNRYRIQKVLYGRRVSYGSYDTLEDAVKVRDELIKCNWDKKQLNKIREETGVRITRRIRV